MGGLEALRVTATSTIAVLTYMLLLTAVFAWAGFAKIRHPYPAAVAAVHFRVLRRPRRLFGVVLGAWEILLAISLLLPATRGAAAAVACATSLGFFVVIAAALLRGERFDCSCLGSADEIGPFSLARAGWMVCAAGVVATNGSVEIATSNLPKSILIAAVVIAVPVLAATYRGTRSLWISLDSRLDWEWIMQQHTAQEAES